ncbi:MAG: translation initiation factor IF-1 [Bryobacterales bacterium]|nr:translation initiation factor IF-1 [Bryobacterales bacterium]
MSENMNIGARAAEGGARGTGTPEPAGTVLEELPSLLYRVRLDGGGVVSASATGRHGLAFLRLLPGDRVRLRLAERDVTRARILERMER